MAKNSDQDFTMDAPVSMSSTTAAAPVSDGNEEFPVPFSRFVGALAGTPDEVYTTLMRQRHGFENRLPSAWRSLLDGYKNEPAHPEHPDFDPAKHG